MFSPRLLAVFAVLATVAALPADIPRPVSTITDVDDDIEDSQWFSFPMFSNLFAPLWRLLPSFSDIGPKIITEDNAIKIIVSVKDFKPSDLKVKVKDDLIFVQGSHAAKQEDREVFASQFFHTYSLPLNSSADDVTAELSSDGYLIVSAPLNRPSEKKENIDRDVPIVQTSTPYKKEGTTERDSTTVKDDQPLTSTTAQAISEAEDERKEPTTPSSVITEKDNRINEINP